MRRAAAIVSGCLMALVVGCSSARMPDPGQGARNYGSRASTLFTEGNFSGALSEYKKAYAAAARVDLPLLQAQYLFNLGRVFYEAGLLDSAKQAFYAAYRDFRYYNDSPSAAASAGFVALVWSERGVYDSAFSWMEKGRPVNLKKNEEIAFWLTIQAKLCILQKRTPEAFAYLDRAMACYKKEKMYGGMAQVGYYRAQGAFSLSRYDEALFFLNEALLFSDRSPDRYRRWRILLAAATVSFCLKNEDDGMRFFKRGLDCMPKGIVFPSREQIESCPAEFWNGQ